MNIDKMIRIVPETTGYEDSLEIDERTRINIEGKGNVIRNPNAYPADDAEIEEDVKLINPDKNSMDSRG